MDLSSLKEAGLTEGEIKVYVALLEIGLSTSGPIIEKSGIARSIIYQILEKLMQKGLVSQITKEKTHFYQAAQPTKILDYIEERKNKLELNKNIVEKLIPQLLLKQQTTPKSETNMYFGFKGIRTAHEHTYLKLKKGEEYCYLGIPSQQPLEQHLYWQRDHVKCEKTGIRRRLLFNRGTPLEVLKNRNSYKFCEARIMESDVITPASFNIFKDTILIILQVPQAIAVEIINQEIANSFQSYFEEYWKRSKPFK